MAEESTIQHNSLFPHWISKTDDCPTCYEWGTLDCCEIKDEDDPELARVTAYYICKQHHRWGISHSNNGKAVKVYKEFLKEKREKSDA
jgi:hypothetical protein